MTGSVVELHGRALLAAETLPGGLGTFPIPEFAGVAEPVQAVVAVGSLVTGGVDELQTGTILAADPIVGSPGAVLNPLLARTALLDFASYRNIPQ